MTKEQLKQKARDFVQDWLRDNLILDEDALVQFAAEATKELQEENAELKGIKDVATLIRANNDTVTTLMQLNNNLVSKRQQLTKAKEIIENLLGLLPDEVLYHDFYNRTYVDPAKQFLSEVEE